MKINSHTISRCLSFNVGGRSIAFNEWNIFFEDHSSKTLTILQSVAICDWDEFRLYSIDHQIKKNKSIFFASTYEKSFLDFRLIKIMNSLFRFVLYFIAINFFLIGRCIRSSNVFSLWFCLLRYQSKIFSTRRWMKHFLLNQIRTKNRILSFTIVKWNKNSPFSWK